MMKEKVVHLRILQQYLSITKRDWKLITIYMIPICASYFLKHGLASQGGGKMRGSDQDLQKQLY